MPDDASNALPILPPETDRWKAVNDLYRQWKDTSENERDGIVHRLYPHLKRHAEWMVWDILRRSDPHLASEMVNDLILELPTFGGRSKFSTWAHSHFKYRCIDELRYRKRRPEESWDAHTELFREQHEPSEDGTAVDDWIQIEQLLTELKPRELEIAEAIVRGETLEAIGKQHERTKAGVRHILKERIPVQLGLIKQK